MISDQQVIALRPGDELPVPGGGTGLVVSRDADGVLLLLPEEHDFVSFSWRWYRGQGAGW